MEHMEGGYKREKCNEPFILEPEDWTPEEWKALCKLCVLPEALTERIVIHASEIESYVKKHTTIERNWPDDAVEALRKVAPDVAPAEESDRTYIVTELCPHCDNEIEMTWNTDELGYKAFCPVCGKRLMLCDECRHTEGVGGCDYDSGSDTCRFNRAEPDQSPDDEKK